MSIFTKKHSEKEVELTISTSTFFKVVALVIGTILLLACLQKAGHALLLIFIAFFLALSLNTPVHFIARHLPWKLKGNRTFATAVSFILVVAILGVFIASLLPPLIKQTQSFISYAPHLINDLRSQDSDLGKFVQRYNLESQVSEISGQLSERLKNSAGSAFSTISSVGSSLFAVLTILALTFMMLIEGPRWLRIARSLTPPNKLPTAERIAASMYKVVRGYVNGQVTLAFIAALALFPGLYFLHISYPIALMFVVFICGLIPMVGHSIGAAIVTLVALFHSPQAAAIILVYYFLYQQAENYFLQPRIQANSTDMSPLLVFGSVVVGVSFSGLFGGLVAIPLAGCVRILVLEYLQSRRLFHDSEIRKQVEEVTVEAAK